MGKEIWKDIKGFEGSYQVSDLGNIKSLSRIMRNSFSYYLSKDKIMNGHTNKRGYKMFILRKNNKNNGVYAHRLVAQAFKNYDLTNKKLVIDHIDNDKSNNNVDNLQIITQRANCSKKETKRKTSSKYVGVSMVKNLNKWISQIRINKVPIVLGYYKNEIEAHHAYQKALSKL